MTSGLTRRTGNTHLDFGLADVFGEIGRTQHDALSGHNGEPIQEQEEIREEKDKEPEQKPDKGRGRHSGDRVEKKRAKSARKVGGQHSLGSIVDSESKPLEAKPLNASDATKPLLHCVPEAAFTLAND